MPTALDVLFPLQSLSNPALMWWLCFYVFPQEEKREDGDNEAFSAPGLENAE